MNLESIFSTFSGLENLPPALRKQAEILEVRAGEFLFRSGDQVHSVLYVLSGEIRLVRTDRSGREIILQRSRGGYFAEASFASVVYHCDAVSGSQGEVLRFPIREFQDFLQKDKQFNHSWMLLLAREVRRLRAQCERLSLHGAAERVTHYIESEGSDREIILVQSRRAWAGELGLSHEALYRTLNKMRTQGALEMEGKTIRLMR